MDCRILGFMPKCIKGYFVVFIRATNVIKEDNIKVTILKAVILLIGFTES